MNLEKIIIYNTGYYLSWKVQQIKVLTYKIHDKLYYARVEIYSHLGSTQFKIQYIVIKHATAMQTIICRVVVKMDIKNTEQLYSGVGIS